MASTLTGIATIYALDGFTIAYTGMATADNEPQSISRRDGFDVAKARGKDGQIFAKGYSGREITIEIEIIVKGGASRAAAPDKFVEPAPGALVTLDGFGANTAIEGTWNYEGGSFEVSNADFNKYRLTLVRAGEAPTAALAVIA